MYHNILLIVKFLILLIHIIFKKSILNNLNL